jgi:nitrite reductase/ring-hydroxylating ferredoxin subunit
VGGFPSALDSHNWQWSRWRGHTIIDDYHHQHRITGSMTVLCSVDELVEGDAKGFSTDTDALFALKRDGQIFVYRNSCPHLGVELNWLEDQFLDTEGILIQCATHGALFVVETGACVAGPCRGKSLEAIPFSLVDGHIEI